VDEERAARVREEARILFGLRNHALDLIAAGDERAETLLAAVDSLLGERELEAADSDDSSGPSTA
jgi:hypothetical protein